MKGKLIVIEGLDGSGKATQSDILFNSLKEITSTIKISFPDYSQPSSSLAKMYLNSEFGSSPEDVNAYAASSFFAVDRYASYMKFWRKNYQNGDIIISDRYVTSNMVFHLPKLDKTKWDNYIDWLDDYEYTKLELPKPDLVIYLDVPVELSQRFMNERYKGDESKKDLHERNLDFLKRCRDAAIYAAEKNNWHVVKCFEKGIIKNIQEIHDLIFGIVKKVIL